jgi:hypothetical protein
MLKVPSILSGPKLGEFFDTYHNILCDFADFKRVNQRKHPSHDLFFKLATKTMFFVVKIPSQTAFLSKDCSHIQLDFYLMREKHVMLSEHYLDELPYHRSFVARDAPDIF